MKKNFRIGYACTPISIPYRSSRSVKLSNFTEANFNKCTKDNLDDLYEILKWNIKNDIYMFRISSDIIPFGSHPINKIKWWDEFNTKLKEIGKFIKDNKIRVSMHPGQYTVLNSPNSDVVKRSIDDLEYHCKFLDSLNVDYTNKIVLHVGGVYNEKVASINRFIQNFQLLSSSLKRRLTIENDDKSYTIEDVLNICKQVNVPPIFDNLHHELNPCNLKLDEIINKVSGLWKSVDGKVKFHYSDQDLIKKGGAHSKTVDTSNFLDYLKIIENIDADIMLEVKDKEISAIKCICTTNSMLTSEKRMDQWDKYKYLIMEKSENDYNYCKELINSKTPISDVYKYIDKCLIKSSENFKNTVLEIYVRIKHIIKEKEQIKYLKLLDNIDENKDIIKNYLKLLAKKYSIDFLLDSYYFIY